MSMRNSGISRRAIWQLGLVAGSLLAVTLAIVACSSGSSGTSASGMGKVSVSISDPATCQVPTGPYSAVWVTITEVDANTSATAANSDSGWVSLTPKGMTPVQVNLLGQANNQCFLATLGDPLELQAGNYQQIRIMLAPTSPTGNTAGTACGGKYNNCVVVNSDTGGTTTTQTYPLQLSSEAQTGIKIPSGQLAGGQFSIASGKTEDLDIDFNTCESIVQQGNGQYRLKPVLHAGEASTTSVSMNGTVVDATGSPVANAIVSLEQPDGTEDSNMVPIDRVVASTTTDANGNWNICPLVMEVDGDPSKPYDLVITGSANGVIYAPSIVTGISMGSTAGKVTLNAAASGSTSASTLGTITGQVTSNATSTSAQAVDVYLSILETVKGVDYTIPLPSVAATSTTQAQVAGNSMMVTTAATANMTNPACPNNSDCYDYTLFTQGLGAYIGAWSSGGVTMTQPNPIPTTILDGNATAVGTTSETCDPSEQFASAVLAGSPLAVGNVNLAFSGCSAPPAP